MKIIDGLFSRAISNNCRTNLCHHFKLHNNHAWMNHSSNHLSESPCHLLTRSLELTLKKVLLASVATAFARYDFPVPGGPYSRIPRHGVRFPVKRWGNFIGRMTASFNEAFALSKPATSSHFTFGASVMMAPERPARNFFVSGS